MAPWLGHPLSRIKVGASTPRGRGSFGGPDVLSPPTGPALRQSLREALNNPMSVRYGGLSRGYRDGGHGLFRERLYLHGSARWAPDARSQSRLD